MTINNIKSGDKIYVPTSLYVYRGADDFVGGIATVNEVTFSDTLPEDHFNYAFVSIKERPRTNYNLKNLLEKQLELKEKYGDRLAHADPNNDPEFNNSNADWK